jgi:Kef-type K+ transport system membrane component KefB
MTSVQEIFDYLKSVEVLYILLIFVIFIVPKLLQRLRLPAAITAFGIGVAFALGFGYFQDDATVKLLATLGIVTLFLHAGLDINISDLRRNQKILVQHVLLFVMLLAVAATLAFALFDIPMRLSLLIALALATPSTGFILDSIRGLDLTSEEKEWVKTKAVATELVALVLMFFTLQSLTLSTFLISIGTVLALIVLIPLLFRFFATKIAPFAPDSEFAFLIMLATACAFITRKIGAYYLVGAFVVGIAARQFQQKIPSVTSERLIGAVELFASFFVPFYFFYSGSQLTRDDFTSSTWLLALIFVASMIPMRTLMVILHRRVVLRESTAEGSRVAVTLLPTLVFTLVLAQLMREHFDVGNTIYGALIIYAIANSLIVSFVFRGPQPDYSVHVLEDGVSRIEGQPPEDPPPSQPVK